MPRTRLLFAMVLLGSTQLGCSGKRDSEQPDVNGSLVASIRSAERIVIYEGLPHQTWEPKQLEEERKRKPTLVFHSHDFYKEPLELSADDIGRLRQLIGDESTFHPFRPGKKCGGFHPDYAVEWTVDGVRYEALLCFGCWEVKFFGPTQANRNDISGDGRDALKEVLHKYRKNRPEPKRDE